MQSPHLRILHRPTDENLYRRPRPPAKLIVAVAFLAAVVAMEIFLANKP